MTQSADLADSLAHGLSNTFRLSNENLETIYKSARADSPVTFLPDIGYWAVTRYEDVKSILRDTSSYSCEVAMDPITPFSEEMKEFLQSSGFGGKSNMVANASQTHPRIRRHAQKGFVPQRMKALEPRIRELTDQAIDDFIDRGRIDLVDAMLYELPAIVLFLLLGIDDSEVANVKRWADNRLLLIFGKLTPEQQMQAARELVDYWHFCIKFVGEKSQSPGNDLTSQLLQDRRENSESLSMEDIHNIVFGLLLAGHETTSNMSANAVLALLEADGAWQALADDPELIPQAVEELIRYRPSVVAWRRKALADATVAGTEVPEGSRLLLFLASANRDDNLFAQAERLDLRRENSRSHISFGYGAHFCLGAPLARLELKLIIEQLTKRIPKMRLDTEPQHSFIETVQFRGPKKLLVRWD
jgi:cytochrome P450